MYFERLTQNATFQFNNEFYQQLDGDAMGSPTGSLLADVRGGVADPTIEAKDSKRIRGQDQGPIFRG